MTSEFVTNVKDLCVYAIYVVVWAVPFSGLVVSTMSPFQRRGSPRVAGRRNKHKTDGIWPREYCTNVA